MIDGTTYWWCCTVYREPLMQFSHQPIGGRNGLPSYFTKEKTGSDHKVTCPRSHHQWAMEPGFKARFVLTSKTTKLKPETPPFHFQPCSALKCLPPAPAPVEFSVHMSLTLIEDEGCYGIGCPKVSCGKCRWIRKVWKPEKWVVYLVWYLWF